jgi:hypothetical protein
MSQHTPGPWRVYKSDRFGESGNKHADVWLIESDTRKAMAMLEVWALNSSPKWRRENRAAVLEHRETISEVKANAHLIAAAPELLAAVREFVSYGRCRQANTAERKMLAEHFAQLAKQYSPLLERFGVAPHQISQVDFDELNGRVAIAKATA